LTILDAQGFEILVAHVCAGALAIQDAHAGRTDLAVVDLTRLDGLGTRAAVQLQSLPPEMKFLFASGTPKDCWLENCSYRAGLPIGNWDFLSKPFLPRAFVEKIQGRIGVRCLRESASDARRPA
jgi:hypothetical protein